MGAADADGIAEEIKQTGHQQARHQKEVALQLVLAEAIDAFHRAGPHQTAHRTTTPATGDEKCRAAEHQIREGDREVSGLEAQQGTCQQRIDRARQGRKNDAHAPQ